MTLDANPGAQYSERDMKKPMIKKRKTIRSRRFPIILIGCGLALLSLWGAHRFFYNRSITLSDALVSQYNQKILPEAMPIAISIDEIPPVPVVEAGKINNTWTISPTAANYVLQSALPGTIGNIIIYGHNTAKIFGKLNAVKVGTPISITSSNGIQHRYRVIQKQIVSIHQTELLAPTRSEVLTLYTCAGWLDSQRLVIRAIPL